MRRIKIQQCILNCYLCTHGKYYSSFFRAYYTHITSSDGQNISCPICKSLEIFHFPKYSICGTAVHKTHFFFHWIDLQCLYETNIILVSYSHTYISLLLQRYYIQYPITIFINTNITYHKFLVLSLLHRLIDN
jgi:hypothetical protein